MPDGCQTTRSELRISDSASQMHFDPATLGLVVNLFSDVTSGVAIYRVRPMPIQVR